MVDLVAGPTTGGVILAFETARQLGVRSIFAEEVTAADGTTHREFRRGFRIEPGERVLLVDDILTTGGSLLAMLPAVEAMGGEIVECVVLVDRSGGRATLTSPRHRPDLPAALALAAGPADLRAGRRHVPALRGRHAAVRAREHRDHRERRGTGRRLRMDPRTRNVFVGILVVVIGLTAAAAILLGQAGPASPPPGTDAVEGIIVSVDSAGLTDVKGFDLRPPTARR